MPQARTITPKQAVAFVAFLQTTKNASRNVCAFALTYYAGMRIAEVAALSVADVLTDTGSVKDVVYLTAAMTKGKNGREVFLNKTAKQHIAAHIRSVHLKPADALICTMGKRKRFSPNSLSIALKNLYVAAGYVGCSSHTGRRSFCTNLSNSGVGIRVIQKLSGHRSLQSVQPYLDANEDMVKNAAELVA